MANGDLFPPPTYAQAFPRLAPLIENTAAQDEFKKGERAALFWKGCYIWFGVLSLMAAALAMVLIAWQTTIGRSITNLPYVGIAGSVLGAVGLTLQFALVFGRFKQRWLNARFWAEQVRAIKFQAFMPAIAASNAAQIEPAVRIFTEQQLASLAIALRTGHAAEAFDPVAALPAAPPILGAEDILLLGELKSIYADLRLKLQRSYFTYEAGKEQGKRTITEAVSELSFWAASFLALAQLALSSISTPAVLAPYVNTDLQNFLVVVLFVMSAVLAIYHYGRAHFSTSERYRQYSVAVSHMIDRLNAMTTRAEVMALVREMELTALRELDDFYRHTAPRSLVF